MSHAPHEVVRRHVRQIREIAAATGTGPAILMDLQGPAIRTGEVPATITLKTGDEVELRQPGTAATRAISTTTNYPGLAADLKIGATVLVDNGVLHFQVISKDSERIICRVLTGGQFGSRRHINLPGTRVNLPGLTENDLTAIDLAAELNVDFVAMSFVRDAAHVRDLRRLLTARQSTAQIVAKIEDQSAVENIDEIIMAADAIMVARGDLGVEVPIEELPIIQRRIVAKCVHVGRKVIVATHMLESMISAPVPTRAEMTDAANAVFEKADAIMLSGETSVGKFPVLCVEILDRIARRAELASRDEPSRADHADLRTDKQKLVRAAVALANSLDDAHLLVFTQRGVMAAHTAHLRPDSAAIFAFTPSLEVARTLHLNRAVQPYVMDFCKDDPHATIEAALAVLKNDRLIQVGDPVIIISDVLVGECTGDSVLMRRV
jgi:pyruvate kinase